MTQENQITMDDVAAVNEESVVDKNKCEQAVKYQEKLIDPATMLERGAPERAPDGRTIHGKRPVTRRVLIEEPKPAFTQKKKTYISTPEAKIAAIRTAKDTAKSLGKIDYYNGLEAALAILQDRPAQMQPAPKWFWFRTDRTGIRG